MPTNSPSHVMASAIATIRNHRAAEDSSRFEFPSGAHRHAPQDPSDADRSGDQDRSTGAPIRLVARNALSEQTTAIEAIEIVLALLGIPKPGAVVADHRADPRPVEDPLLEARAGS